MDYRHRDCSLQKVTIQGGTCGLGQTVRTCRGQNLCSMCNLGKSGKDGFALKAINSKIDTVQVIIGELSLDSASTITRGTLFSKSPRHIQQINSRNASFIYRSGIICVEHNTDFYSCGYRSVGKIYCYRRIESQKWTMPPMNRGVYIVTVKKWRADFSKDLSYPLVMFGLREVKHHHPVLDHHVLTG